MVENNQITASTTNTKHDHTCSGKKMEGGENGLNTVESLRGRLLAERQASRAAKEEADSLANKFLELEKKLMEEIKLRDKAQRKLQFLKKKLESLNNSTSSGKLKHSSISENCQNYGGSSSYSSSSTHSEAEPQITNPTLSENADQNHNFEEESVLIQNDNNSEQGQILCKNPNKSSKNLMNDGSRLSSVSPKSSVTENEDDNEDFFVDNSLALVPVTFAAATSNATNNHKPLHESTVLEALDALKRAREGLLCSMGTRPMIKVCPTH